MPHLNWQAVAVPAKAAGHVVALHGLVASHHVLDGASQDVAVVGQPGGKRWAIVEVELRLALRRLHFMFRTAHGKHALSGSRRNKTGCAQPHTCTQIHGTTPKPAGRTSLSRSCVLNASKCCHSFKTVSSVAGKLKRSGTPPAVTSGRSVVLASSAMVEVLETHHASQLAQKARHKHTPSTKSGSSRLTRDVQIFCSPQSVKRVCWVPQWRRVWTAQQAAPGAEKAMVGLVWSAHLMMAWGDHLMRHRFDLYERE